MSLAKNYFYFRACNFDKQWVFDGDSRWLKFIQRYDRKEITNSVKPLT